MGLWISLRASGIGNFLENSRSAPPASATFAKTRAPPLSGKIDILSYIDPTISFYTRTGRLPDGKLQYVAKGPTQYIYI